MPKKTQPDAIDSYPQPAAQPLSRMVVELVCSVLRLLNLRDVHPHQMCGIFGLGDGDHEKTINKLMRFNQKLVTQSDPPLVRQILYSILEKYADDEELAPLISILAHQRRYDEHLVSDAIKRVFRLSSDDFRICSNHLSGSYVCHRYSKDGSLRTECIDVLSYSDQTGVSIFKTHYKRRSTGARLHEKSGFIIPIRRDFIVLCDISYRKGEENPEPGFTVIKHPGFEEFSYMVGVYLDTDLHGYPWSSRVYVGRIPGECTKDHITQNQKIEKYEGEFRDTIRAVIGDGPIAVIENTIDGDVQEILANHTRYISR